MLALLSATLNFSFQLVVSGSNTLRWSHLCWNIALLLGVFFSPKLEFGLERMQKKYVAHFTFFFQDSYLYHEYSQIRIFNFFRSRHLIRTWLTRIYFFQSSLRYSESQSQFTVPTQSTSHGHHLHCILCFLRI